MLEKNIFIYIYEELKKKRPLSEQRCKAFLQCVGLDRENVRQMLQLQRTVTPLSEQNIQWSHIYGKNPQLNLEQYIKKSNQLIRYQLEEKKIKVLEQIEDCLVQAIKREGDAFFALQLLGRENHASLYAVLEKEGDVDYLFLQKLHMNTYQVLEKEMLAAEKERGGILGKREERIADLLSSIDHYVQQGYEILRYEMMEEIYEVVLKNLQPYMVDFPKGNLPIEIKKVFEAKGSFGVSRGLFIEA